MCTKEHQKSFLQGLNQGPTPLYAQTLYHSASAVSCSPHLISTL